MTEPYKVALSASHYNLPKVAELLDTCDVIYTTQWKNLEALQDRFYRADVRPIPDSCADLINFLKSRQDGREPAAEFVTFGTIMDIIRKHYEWDETDRMYVEKFVSQPYEGSVKP